MLIRLIFISVNVKMAKKKRKEKEEFSIMSQYPRFGNILTILLGIAFAGFIIYGILLSTLLKPDETREIEKSLNKFDDMANELEWNSSKILVCGDINVPKGYYIVQKNVIDIVNERDYSMICICGTEDSDSCLFDEGFEYDYKGHCYEHYDYDFKVEYPIEIEDDTTINFWEGESNNQKYITVSKGCPNIHRI